MDSDGQGWTQWNGDRLNCKIMIFWAFKPFHWRSLVVRKHDQSVCEQATKRHEAIILGTYICNILKDGTIYWLLYLPDKSVVKP